MSRILLHGIPLSPSWIIWMMLPSASPAYVSNGSAITGSWISSGTGSKRKDKWYKNHLHSPPCHDRKCLTFPLHLNSPPTVFFQAPGISLWYEWDLMQVPGRWGSYFCAVRELPGPECSIQELFWIMHMRDNLLRWLCGQQHVGSCRKLVILVTVTPWQHRVEGYQV